MPDQKPSKGRIVFVTTPGHEINGSAEHAAIVTVAHSDECVSTKIFPSGSWPVESITSVMYFDPPHPAMASWRWPPRV